MSIKNLDLQISKRVEKTQLGNDRMNRRVRTKKAESVYLQNIIQKKQNSNDLICYLRDKC